MIGRHLTHIPLFSGMLKLKRRAHIHVVLYTAFNLCCNSRIFRIVVGRRIYFFLLTPHKQTPFYGQFTNTTHFSLF